MSFAGDTLEFMKPWMVLSLFLAPLLFAFGCVSSSTNPTRGPSQASSEKVSLSDSLTKIIADRVRPLDRTMVTFHYESENIRPQSLEDVRRRLTGRQARFFDVSLVDNNMVGPGTYVAIDPVGSRSFGGKDPQLYVIPVPQGVRVLDGFRSLMKSETDFFKDLTQKMNCKKEYFKADAANDFSAWIGFFRNNETLECRTLLIDAFSRAHVEAIMYGYVAAYHLKTCRAGLQVALNLVAESAVDLQRISFFSNSAQFGGGPIQNFALFRLFKDASTDYQMQLVQISRGSDEMPATLKRFGESPKPFSYHWKASKIGRCGKTWSLETSLGDMENLATLVQRLRVDEDVRRLIVATAREFVAMKNRLDPQSSSPTDFELAKLKGVAYQVFLASGLPQDDAHFERWLKAYKLAYELSSPAPPDPKVIGELLEEDEPDAAAILQQKKSSESMARDLFRSDADNPHFMWRFYGKYGYGPRLQLISANMTLLLLGQVPYLTAPFPWGGDPTVPVRIDQDAIVIKAVLQTCLDVYRKAQSLEEVLAGSCGMIRGR